MATLTNNTIASTYAGLLSVNGAISTGSVEVVEDGAGTNTALWLSTVRAALGVDDIGADFRVYSATASEGLFYDASEDEFGLLLTTKLKFHDIGGGEEIYASSDGHLEINAGTTLDITAPTVDLNSATEFNIDTVLYDLNASGAVTIDSAGISMDSSAASNLTTSSGALTITSAAAATWSTAAGALAIDAAASTLTLDGHTGVTIQSSNSGDITLDSSTDIVLDAAGGNFEFKDAGVAQLTIDVDGTAGDIDIDLEVDGDDLVFNQYDGTEVMRITDDATVGIGETAPDAFLCINQGADDSSILTLKSSDVAHGMTDIVETDTYGRFRKVAAGYGGLKIDGLVETGEYSSVIIEGNGTDDDTTRSTSARGNIELRGYKTSSAGHTGMNANQNLVVISNAVAAKFIFDTDGDAHADGSAGFTVYSDLRLKTDIETIPYGLAEVLQLQPKKFKKASGSFDEGGNVVLEDNARVSIGFIAQELKLIIPEMIKEIDETNSFYSLNVGQVTPVLVKAIQELSASNDALKARIEVLEG